MRGGSQSQLMRCSDDGHYVVKFQDNPQGTRILANELLGTQLAARLGLPVAQAAVCYVSEELIRITPDLCVETSMGRVPCRRGLHFGSRYPLDPRRGTLFDLLPAGRLMSVENIGHFLGMLVFDRWTCNIDGRQAVFFQREAGGAYRAVMIDQGGCFGGAAWSLCEAPRHCLYFPRSVYKQVKGMADFEPWLAGLETGITEAALHGAAGRIPLEWYAGDSESLHRLLEVLYVRRRAVPDLLLRTWQSSRDTFPNWNRRVTVPMPNPEAVSVPKC